MPCKTGQHGLCGGYHVYLTANQPLGLDPRPTLAARPLTEASRIGRSAAVAPYSNQSIDLDW